ncbi:MAG: hypothetical protein AAF721_39040, partial [Myxococcota bacterium]
MTDDVEVEPVVDEEVKTPDNWRPLLGLVLALVAFSIGYRLIVVGKLEQSSVLFILLPGLFAILLGMVPTRKSSLGFVLKAVTIALLMSMVVLGEGMVCVLMAAPIMYGVVLATWAIAQVLAYFLGPRIDDRKIRCSLAIPLVLISLEGVNDDLSFDRTESVVVTRVTSASAAEVAARLATPPRFDDALPTSLQLGFPRPQWIEADGLALGDEWRVRFAGGEGVPGTLVLEVVERTPGLVRFAALQDT